MAPQPVSTSKISLDSLQLDSIRNSILNEVSTLQKENYIDQLERINSEMMSYWNFPMWLITALGVLFTVAAIVATIIIWRQGAEYQSKIDGVIESVNESYDSFKNDYENQLKSIIGDLKNAKVDYSELIKKVEINYLESTSKSQSESWIEFGEEINRIARRKTPPPKSLAELKRNAKFVEFITDTDPLKVRRCTSCQNDYLTGNLLSDGDGIFSVCVYCQHQNKVN